MNHLRELMEHLPKSVGVDPHIGDSLGQQLLHIAPVVASMAQCFWMGDMDGICELQVVPELSRLPFQTVWFEGQANSSDTGAAGALIGVLAYQRKNGNVDCLCFGRRQRQWALMFGVNDLHMERGSFALTSGHVDVVTLANYVLYALRAFCCAMNCTNVGLKEHKAEPKLQKARAQRGKAPLFSYWTLMLKGRGGETGHLGGSHSSPRVHLRRGHPRQYTPGKWTWVQAHAVGNPKLGMVHKDYAWAGARAA